MSLIHILFLTHGETNGQIFAMLEACAPIGQSRIQIERGSIDPTGLLHSPPAPNAAVDLILLDSVLDVDESIVQQLCSLAPQAPLLMIGSTDDTESEETALRAGAQAYLSRAHLTPYWLGHTLRQLLRGRTQPQTQPAHTPVETQLRERVEEMEALMDLLPVAVFVAHDPECKFITGNRTAYQLLRQPFGANLSGSAPPEDRPTNFRVFRHGQELTGNELPFTYAALHGVEVREAEIDLHFDNGDIVNTFSYAKPLFDAEGKVRGCFGVNLDISEYKRIEHALHELNETLERQVAERTADLEHTNRDLDQFVYIASHDLKAPLRAITLLAQWIEEDSAGLLPEVSQGHLQKLRQRALRMERLLDDLLAYSRAGRLRHPQEAVDSTALVRSVVDLLDAPAGFTVEMSAPMPQIETERVPLETVLRNLIGNTLKHHHQPQMGHVSISAQESDEGVEFMVRDNGPGIDEQFHERIFGVFQTLRPRDEVEGSGIGLALVKRIVERRGGKVSVESAPHQGATFRFTWPKHPL